MSIKHIATLVATVLFSTPSGAEHPTTSRWGASWAASQQSPETASRLSDQGLTDATLRQVVRLFRLAQIFGQTTSTCRRFRDSP